MANAASTWGIVPAVRGVLRSRILELRTALEEDADRQLAAVGLTEQRAGDVPGGRSLSDEEQRLRETASLVITRSMEAGEDYPTARSAFTREAAYTLLDRAVAFRCLEERGQLLIDGQPETLIRRDAGGTASILWRLRQEEPDLTARDLARLGYRRAGAAMSERIKVLFDPDAEYAVFFPLPATWERLVAVLNAPEIPADTYREDEVLGWVYQYWNSAEKDRVYAKLGKGGKIETPGELSAASCLYTERYIVDYLVQNTLGTLWTEMHPDSSLPETWPYFVRPPEGNPPVEREVKRVRDIRLLDPACGSGHFLVRAFELFRQLYAAEGLEDPTGVPALILEHNLYGIDIDRRATQIAALALYLKGCEVAGPEFRPRKLNLVAADLDLPSTPPAAFLERFVGQPDLAELATSLWSGLAGVQTFGSLLHPEREVNQTFDRLRKEQRGTLWASDAGEWAKRRRQLLSGLRQAIDAEAESPNLGRHLFGTHASRALDLVQILSLRYDVCVANPPYSGSKNLPDSVAERLKRDYRDGRGDTYAAFMLRSRDLCAAGGYVGMVTQQSWLFLKSFAKLRGSVLREDTVATLAHLGERAFEDKAAAGAYAVAFTFRPRNAARAGHRLWAARLTDEAFAADKARALRESARNPGRRVHTPLQSAFDSIPDSPLSFWLTSGLLQLLSGSSRLEAVATVRQGLATADNDRFYRGFWEVSNVAREHPNGNDRWYWLSRGGRYQRWAGLEWAVVDWADDGAAIKAHITKKYPYLKGNWGWVVKNAEWYFRPGATYTFIAAARLGGRYMSPSIFDVASMGVFPYNLRHADVVVGLLCARIATFMLRVLTQSVMFNGGYFQQMPIPQATAELSLPSRTCFLLKSAIVSHDAAERRFAKANGESDPGSDSAAILHALEGWNERLVFDAYELGPEDVQAVLDETGFPPGWQPLVAGYDALPEAPDGIEIPDGLAAFLGSLEHRELSADGLAALKSRLRKAYVNGPGVKLEAEESAPKADDEESAVLGARIPIPTETFIEELADKLAIHPISVYWLLEELKAAGVVSPPLRKAELTDYVSVSLLRMLGCRWPEQDAYEAEHGPILDPDLVDPDGIVPVVPCAAQPTAEAHIRTRLERRFGPEGAATFLADFRRYAVRELDDWLKRDFFKAHVSQFKSRPIAWHFRSPAGHFQAFVLYHRLSLATLQKLRAQYAGDRIATLRAEQARARERGETARVSDLQVAIEDVEAFRERIAAIERGDTLTDRIRCRWKEEEAEGRPGPYAPDIDDGVKVNIRPFQENGLLAAKVISKW